ncbi:nitronate monooxygenase family protein [Mucilaginibacter gynuensis]|uniref:Propionate 3-nitronate monooxygenase n=1 Tax=Mucilaginibacter gynuensis TaxID=1302236 RepID=A0ABP8G289_9SPHI
MNRKNEVTQLFNVEYPIIQAPMLGVTTPEMVAAVSNNGGLGSLPVGGLSVDRTRALIHQTKALTQKPFAVNLFANANAMPNKEQVKPIQNFIKQLAAKHGLDFEEQSVNSFEYYTYQDQIAILIQEQIPVVSFTFGIIDNDSIEALKRAGTILIGTATSSKEAELIAAKNIDMITAQGIEAGGHRGTFLDDEPLPMVGSMSLIPQIVSRVTKPVIAAGGIMDGGSIKAAFALGAKAVQVGTTFIASDESMAIAAYKTALQNSVETDSMITRSISGRWARGLRNTLITELEASGIEAAPYPVQYSLVMALRNLALATGNIEFINMWAGQSGYKAQAKPSAEILLDLVKQAEMLDVF